MAGGIRLKPSRPDNLSGKQWFRVCDTAGWMESQDNFKSPGREDNLQQREYWMAGRSVVILIEK